MLKNIHNGNGTSTGYKVEKMVVHTMLYDEIHVHNINTLPSPLLKMFVLKQNK